MKTRKLISFGLALFALTLASCGLQSTNGVMNHAGSDTWQSDAQLSQLMVGAWRSPRRVYLYLPDGTWCTSRDYPGELHGRWRIRNRHLEESAAFGDDRGAIPNEEHGLIIEITQREIVFDDGHRMERTSEDELE